MKQLISMFSALALLLCAMIGCQSKKANPVTIDPPVQVDTFHLPSGVDGIRRLRYEYVGTAPIHTQTSMLAIHQNKLFRIGSKWPIQVFDISASSWSQIPLPDTSYWRWDGAAVTIGDTIFIAATYFGKSYDILAVHAPSATFRHTHANLPLTFTYPAYCSHQTSLVLLTTLTDSVLQYDTQTGNLARIASNPFYDLNAGDIPLFSGKHGNSLFVFGWAGASSAMKMKKFDLLSHQWSDITFPPILNSGMVTGSVFGDQFILLRDTAMTFQYSISEGKWYLDTSDVRIFPQTNSGSFNIGEWSYCSTDSCLYGTDVYSDTVWKIAR